MGRPYRCTPVFRARMEYIVLNPTWTVPPTILRQDLLPKLIQDPAALTRNQMWVVDHAGQPVDPSQIDWRRYASRPFPYQVVQAPGKDNPLGRIKFIFPNPYQVYLHDTPARELFERVDRAFSSGCIRIERPLELAVLLLDDEARWSLEALSAVIDTGETRTVFVKRRVPVMLLYWTAEAEEDGTAHFRRDLYGRDQQVLEGLAGRFRFHPVERDNRVLDGR